jgi:hypothetical protein
MSDCSPRERKICQTYNAEAHWKTQGKLLDNAPSDLRVGNVCLSVSNIAVLDRRYN